MHVENVYLVDILNNHLFYIGYLLQINISKIKDDK